MGSANSASELKISTDFLVFIFATHSDSETVSFKKTGEKKVSVENRMTQQNSASLDKRKINQFYEKMFNDFRNICILGECVSARVCECACV